jgi:hypothetical protein
MLKDWDPGFELTQESLPLVYDFMRDYLELGYEVIAAAVEGIPRAASPPTTCWRASAKCRSACW